MGVALPACRGLFKFDHRDSHRDAAVHSTEVEPHARGLAIYFGPFRFGCQAHGRHMIVPCTLNIRLLAASVQRLLDDPELHVTARPGVYQIAVDVQREQAHRLARACIHSHVQLPVSSA